jgi:hypothetical protein
MKATLEEALFGTPVPNTLNSRKKQPTAQQHTVVVYQSTGNCGIYSQAKLINQNNRVIHFRQHIIINH